MEHPIWSLLRKNIYTEEGRVIVKDIYEQLERIIEKLGAEDARKLYDMWEEHGRETFIILGELTHNEKLKEADKQPKETSGEFIFELSHEEMSVLYTLSTFYSNISVKYSADRVNKLDAVVKNLLRASAVLNSRATMSKEEVRSALQECLDSCNVILTAIKNGKHVPEAWELDWDEYYMMNIIVNNARVFRHILKLL